MNTYLQSFQGEIQAGWNGSPSPVAFAAELSSASSSVGPTLLNVTTYPFVLMQLDSLKALGVKAVDVAVQFPLLYPPFLNSKAENQAYANFYSQLASDIRARGLKLIVHTGPMLSDSAANGWNVGPFYASLTLQQYESGRAQQSTTVAQLLQPDYLTVLDEPDTEAAQTGFAQLDTVSEATNMLSQIMASLQQSKSGGTVGKGVTVGAGVGSWTPSYQTWFQSFAKTGIRYFDVHVFPINETFLTQLPAMADYAASLGLPLASSQLWLNKVRDSELGVLRWDQTMSRDAFSFWAPLDTAFLRNIVNWANWKNALFISPFWSFNFNAYLTYNNTTSGLSFTQLQTLVDTQAEQNLSAGGYTSTGLALAAMITRPPDTVPPTVPTGVTSLGTTPSSVFLSWTASSDNVGVAGYDVYRNGTPIGTIFQPPYADTILAPYTAYTYTINAYDAAGNVSGMSSPLVVTTSLGPPPSVPANLTGNALSCTQAHLSWSPSTSQIGVAGYNVYRNGGTPIATVTTTSFSDSGLSPLWPYTYAVSAVDTAGNQSTPATVKTTMPADTIPPSVPTNLAARVPSDMEIDLSWSSSTDNVAVAGYKIYRNGTLVATTSSVSYRNTQWLAPKTTYTYTVAAYDKAGNVSAQSTAVSATTLPDTTPPSAPTNLTAQSISYTTVNLCWSASTDDYMVAYYKIYRNGNYIGYSTTTSYQDAKAVPATTYSYTVVALDVAGNVSAFSNALSVTTL